MDSVIEIIKKLDISQLIAFGLMLWFFYTRLNAKMEAGNVALSHRIDKVEVKIEKVAADLNAKIEKVAADLNAKIEKVAADLNAKIEKVAADLNARIERLEDRIDKLDGRMDRLEGRIEKLDGKLNDLDKRVFAIETMMRLKECCMISDERHLKKVE